jgi:hypothetical protein
MVHLIDRRKASIAQTVSLDLVDTDIFMDVDDLDRAIALEFLGASTVLACCHRVSPARRVSSASALSDVETLSSGSASATHQPTMAKSTTSSELSTSISAS